MDSPSRPTLLEKCLLECQDPPDVTFGCVDSLRGDDRSWKLHKAVLSRKSDHLWFGLLGMSGDAESDSYDIYEEDPVAVEQCVTWMYTGKLDAPAYDNEDTAYVAYMELFKTAHYLCLEDLADHCIDQMESRLEKRAFEIQRILHKGKDSADELEKDELQGILQGIQLAHKLRIKPIQKLWVPFIEATFYLILSVDKFSEICMKTAWLRNGIINKLRGLSVPRLPGINSPCERCQEDPFTRENGHYVLRKDNKGREHKLCDKCQQT
ncbi:hypothetical protein F5Y13DRAFT_196722 [Hypoxylon sp. FL1857]|nr:hypothetical protein F5Y13DRAFT_196722 [Hypoxylon sp. FL1857]